MTVTITPTTPTPTPSPPPPTTSAFAQIDGISVFHTLTPDPSSPLMVLLHGFGASSFSYSLFTPPLLSSLPEYSLVAYDAVAFGRTQRPRSLRYYTPTFSARCAEALSNAYSPDSPCVLLAHSMGCLAAAKACLANPSRVKKLILVAPALLPGGELPPPLRFIARALGSLGAWAAVAASYAFGPLLELFLKSVVSNRSFWEMGLGIARGDNKVPENVIDGYFAPTHVKGWERGILNFTRSALRDRARALGEGEDFAQALTGKVDVLIVHGQKDGVVPISNSYRLRDLWKCEMVVFENSGHVPHEEEPERFAAVVKEFLT